MVLKFLGKSLKKESITIIIKLKQFYSNFRAKDKIIGMTWKLKGDQEREGRQIKCRALNNQKSKI